MQISKIETFLVHAEQRNLLFVKVWTDDGLYGIGEAYSAGPDDATAAVIHDFETWLVGRDPRDIEQLWQLMYIGSRFPGGVVTNSAISGIEHALWDILGKSLDAPVWRLLGGKCRDRIRVYQSAGGRTPEEIGERARALVDRHGYTAVKISPQPPDGHLLPVRALVRESVRRMEAVRRAVGDDIDIAVDPHARIFSPADAVELAAALEPYHPLFYEEPLRPENVDALARVARQCRIPIATGEMLYTRYQFRELLAKEACDVVQPDICCAGGISELRKIAAMAEASYVTVAPHNPMGPVATAVNVHLCATISNFLILEYHPDDAPPRRDLISEPMRLERGHLLLPEGPGLGIDLNIDAFERYPFRRWHRGFPFHADSSMALI